MAAREGEAGAGKTPGAVTDRTQERAREDEQFVPVIVKRTDESRRHPDDTLERAVKEGREQLNRRAGSLLLSAVAAGMILGFTALPVGVVVTAMAPLHSALLTRIGAALVYPLGFVICILSGAQLFTEHTATAVYPVLDRKASFGQLLRLWVIVVAGNLIGAAVIASLLAAVEPISAAREGYTIVGRHLVSPATLPLLFSSILAGWLMAQGAWLVISTASTAAQMLSLYAVTFVIGIGGLHHSVAGAVELMTALWVSEEFTIPAAAGSIAVMLLGNLAGGSTLVAILNYAHIRKTQTLGNSARHP